MGGVKRRKSVARLKRRLADYAGGTSRTFVVAGQLFHRPGSNKR